MKVFQVKIIYFSEIHILGNIPFTFILLNKF